MKASHYNTLCQAEDGTWLAFNAMSSGFATLTPAQYEETNKILNDPDGYRCKTEDAKQLKDDLVKGRFIIDDNVDELKILKVRDHSERFNTDTLSLTICPTMTCNFNCLYCYQSKFTFQKMLKRARNITMTDDVKNGLIRFLKGRVDTLRSFHVDWYGGEPLVCLDLVVELSAAFKNICESNGCFYTSGLVTNGYMLDKEAAVRLKKAGVDAALITLDGPPSMHDVRRPLKNGKGTFDVIIDNVKAAVEIMEDINIRINVDKTNYGGMPEFLDILEENGLKDKIRIYFIPLEYDMNAKTEVAKICWAISEFSEREIALSELGVSKGFKVLNLLKVNPRSASRLCSAVKQNYYSVDPSGNLAKCLGDLGDVEHRVGYIDEEGKLNLSHTVVEWLAWSPFEKEDCAHCHVLPICRGGCMFTEVLTKIKGADNVVMKSGRCDSIKSNLPKMLQLYYRAIKNRRGRDEAQPDNVGSPSQLIQPT